MNPDDYHQYFEEYSDRQSCITDVPKQSSEPHLTLCPAVNK